MAAEDFKRKLTAILSADVKGYSRLMGEDEEATVRTITTYREIVTEVVQKHRGRVVDSPGDNILAEFASVVDAVRGAVEIQEELKVRNAELPEDRRMEFRVGVNLGDVIHEDERIYGDGVNVAARVESLADAGGICISRSAFDQVKNKLTLGYENLGEYSVKNIAEPVRIYKVLMDPEAVGKVIGEIRVKPKRGQRPAIAIVIALLLAIGGVVLWKSYIRTTLSPIDVKPAIAVLPFDNMSGDPKQEYFSDGMTDDLITDLSKVSGLLVIARNSTFVYKGKPANIQQVAEELGVRYVLEGSVRRAGEEVRINAQLIDSTTGGHVWAERYDGRMGDIFALQDKITGQIVNALAVRLTADEVKRFEIKETSSMEAYDSFLQGWQHYLSRTPEDFKKAVDYFNKAIELDPDYGRAYAALALTYWRGAGWGWARKMGMRYNEVRIRGVRTMEMAMKNPTSIAHRLASEMFVQKHKFDKAISEAQLALALDPNDAENHLTMARILTYAGRPEEAIPYAERSMLLNPRDKSAPLCRIALARFCMGQFEEAAKLSKEALELNPDFHAGAAALAASYAHLGRIEEARAAMEIYYKGWGRGAPRLEMAMYFFPFKNPEHAESLAYGFLKAGMPGKPFGYFKVSDELKLSGDEITSMFFGTEIAGFVGKNREWRIGRMEDGEAKFWYRSKLIGSGKSWVEGDTLCNQWDKAIGGLKYCMDVFRNPEGTAEEKNEYVLLTDYGIFGCSIEH